MGYTISKNQSGVKKGYIRYRFDMYHPLMGKRERKQIVCQRSVVEILYRRWERQLLEESSGKFLLFEKLDEYLEYIKLRKSEKAYLSDKSLINDIVKVFFNKDTLIKKIKPSHVDDFISWRRKFIITPSYSGPCKRGHVSNSTINRSLSVMNTFFNYCIKREYCEFNPFSRSKLKENSIREVYLTDREINELLEQAYNLDKKDKIFYKIIYIAILSGMRRSEIFGLLWNEIDFDNSIIRLSALKTKSKKRRIIPITPTLREVLLSLKEGNESEFVISSHTPAILKKRWLKLIKKLSFGHINDGTKMRFHDLRHIFSQTLLNKGVGLEDIQSLLGHQSIETTQRRYAMFARPDLLDKASKIDDVIQFKVLQ